MQWLIDRVSASPGSDGQTMAEYALVLAIITLAIITAIASLSSASQGLIQKVVNVL